MTTATTAPRTTPVVFAALAATMADHRLPASAVYLPTLAGDRFEVWVREGDVAAWLAADAVTMVGDREERQGDHGLVVKITVDLVTAIGTVPVDLRWLEQSAGLRSVTR